MEKQIYQLQITLKDSNPKIWRKILTISNVTLSEFHKIVKHTMGWTGSHSYRFENGNDRFAPQDFDLANTNDSAKTSLDSLLQKENDKIKYVYDFDDNWKHEIILEKVLPFTSETKLPLCLDGKRACPPDNCGGIFGYEELLETISNPKHPDFDETIEWVGENFDPEYFDLAEVNHELKF